MSERVIAKKSVSGYIYEPDPSAPSVSEIVEVLKVSRAHVEQARKCFKEHEAHAADSWASKGMLQHIDYLISELEK